MAVDAVHTVHSRPLLVFDAKYKAASATGTYPNADHYQMLAYCTALGVPDRLAGVRQRTPRPKANRQQPRDGHGALAGPERRAGGLARPGGHTRHHRMECGVSQGQYRRPAASCLTCRTPATLAILRRVERGGGAHLRGGD